VVSGEKVEQKTWPLEGHLATKPHDVTSLSLVIWLICSMWQSTGRNATHGSTRKWWVER